MKQLYELFRSILLNMIEITYQATIQSMLRLFKRSLLNMNELTLQVSIQSMFRSFLGLPLDTNQATSHAWNIGILSSFRSCFQD